jgi:hypothetical protein
VPDKYALQCNWLCGLAERQIAHLLMGFGQDASDGNGGEWFAWTETRFYLLPFDAELYAELEALVERFWMDHVQTRRAPDCKPVANRRAFKRLRHGNGNEADGNAEVGGGAGEGSGADSPGA